MLQPGLAKHMTSFFRLAPVFFKDFIYTVKQHITIRGAIKKKEEKVGFCPTFGDPPAPPQYGTPLTNFTKKNCTLDIIH